MIALEGAIARPDVPQHFMVLRNIDRQVTIRHGDTIVARSSEAQWLLEGGKTLYAPVIYLPMGDVAVELEPNDKSTHCPLKGDASYFDFQGVSEIGWTYEDPLPFSQAIRGLIAFHPDKVSVELAPLT